MSGRGGGRTSVDHPFPTPGRGAVVPSAGRFVARARSRRRKAIAAWVVAVLLVVAAGWLLLVSPWATVRAVEVTGTDRIDPAQVRALVDGELGRPLVLVDTGAVAGRVEALRLVAHARVGRQWPGGLRVEVTERRPVAALPALTGSAYRLVDRDGVQVEVVAVPPATVPVVEVDLVTAGAPAVRSALDSLAVMPAGLRAEVRRIGAASGDGVWFALEGGDRVVWGDAGDAALKTAALEALRRETARERKAMVRKGNRAAARRPVMFDVSAPRAPSVQR
jgi:cell division protein FtsQ